MRERVRWVLLTHTHPDHAPGTTRLVKATGAEVLRVHQEAEDADVHVDRAIADGDTIDGTEFRLEVLHTPGHAPNHLCFFLDEERMLFTGDTILERHVLRRHPATRRRHGRVHGDARAAARRSGGCAPSRPGHGDVIDEPGAASTSTSSTAATAKRQISSS